MNQIPDTSSPPTKLLMWAEWRAIAEFGALAAALPFLQSLPKGDGHPALILPGLSASDSSTVALRKFLSGRGYEAYGWDLGRNNGYRPEIRDLKLKRLREIFERHKGRKVSLIGWSLGGVYARLLAHDAPEMVRQVITLGSPLKGDPKANNAWRLYELLAGQSVEEAWELVQTEVPAEVPFTSVYSKTDGVVPWGCSLTEEGDLRENVEIMGSHCGLGHNPQALHVIADRLAQPEETWTPFRNRLRRAG